MKNLSEVNQKIQAQFVEMSEKEKGHITKSLLSFFDISSTATARATYYNTRAEQETATKQIHQKLFSIDRGLYSIMMLLPGLTDYNKQLALIQLLSNPYTQGLLTPSQEGRLLSRILDELSVPRRLNVFLELKAKRINNARTRKLILKNILGTDKLPFWSVKYRNKLAQSLEHAWGKRKASIIAAIAAKSESEWTDKEMNILIDTFKSYTRNVNKNKELLEAVSFLFGNEQNLTQPYLVAYVEAKADLTKGGILPYEVLEGIRSTYHADRTTKEVLELTKAQLTKGQKLAFQDKAEKADVDVKFKPEDYDSIRLYIYAFKKGLTDEISHALGKNAIKVAEKLPF